MRYHQACLLAAAALLAGCGSMRKTFGLNDSTPAHVEPRSTSVFGNWVLDTHPDSTAFAGASLVELALEPGTFAITAFYPTQPTVTVRGTTTVSPEGIMTLTPTEVSNTLASRGSLVMVKDHPYSLMASAAGNTLVFAPPASTGTAPSSVWHKKSAATAAGKITKDSVAGSVEP